MRNIERYKLKNYGLGFLLFGLFLLIFNNNTVRLIGAIETLIGCFSCMIYNIEKFKFVYLIDKELRDLGYLVSFRQVKIWCVVICIALFLLCSIVWGWLKYLGIISSLAFQVVGFIFILLLIPAAKKPDSTEKSLAAKSANQLIKKIPR